MPDTHDQEHNNISHADGKRASDVLAETLAAPFAETPHPAAERYRIEDIVFHPGSQRNMPSVPEICQVDCKIRLSEVLIKFDTEKNGYTGKKTVKYKIVPTDISTVKCEIAAGYYLKKGGKAPVTLKAGTYTLEEGKDYTLSYKNNKTTSAMAKKPPVVIIKGKGFYSGKTEKEFVIEKTAFSQKYST